jgi:hypothetical protein
MLYVHFHQQGNAILQFAAAGELPGGVCIVPAGLVAIGQ